jgi:D-alanyl-D-alanine carboxypeptidase
MKNIRAFLMVILALLMITLSSCKKDKEEKKTDIQLAKLQTMIDSSWNAYWGEGNERIGGLMLKVSTPESDYFVSSNYNDTVTQLHYFRGGSSTKMFTAAAIMLLEEQGKLDIDDVVTDLIPGTSRPYIPAVTEYDIPHKNTITIKQLLQHRAGVYDITNYPIPDTVEEPYAGMTYNDYILWELGEMTHNYSFKEFIGVISKHRLAFGEPGIEFHYSNTGYMLLGTIVEQVSGMSFTEFIKNNFVIPLGLTHTSFNPDPNYRALPEPYVRGYLLDEGVPFDITGFINQSSMIATGNILTTCNDLNIWTKSLITGNAGISQSRVEDMLDYMETFEGHRYYGLGINYTPGLGYGHNGAVWGYMTITRYDPDNQVVFTINASYISLEDLYKQSDCMYSIAGKAIEILGY